MSEVQFVRGDRVRVYNYIGRPTHNDADVLDIEPFSLFVSDQGDGCKGWVHAGQCRKLKKKERRRIKVCLFPEGTPVGPMVEHLVGSYKIGEWVEFVEVKPKK